MRFDDFEALRAFIRRDIGAEFSLPLPERTDSSGSYSASTPAYSSQQGQNVVTVSSFAARTEYPPLIGRDEVVFKALAQMDRQVESVAPLIVGQRGSGRTAVAREIAWQWQELNPNQNESWWVDLAMLLTATSLNERSAELIRLFDCAAKSSRDTLLVLENFHLALGTIDFHDDRHHFHRQTDKHSMEGLALVAAIERGLHVVGTVTSRRMSGLRRSCIRRHLYPLILEDPSFFDLIGQILPPVKEFLSQKSGIEIADSVLPLVVTRSRSLYGCQPSKSISLLAEAVAIAKRKQLAFIGPDDIYG